MDALHSDNRKLADTGSDHRLPRRGQEGAATQAQDRQRRRCARLTKPQSSPGRVTVRYRSAGSFSRSRCWLLRNRSGASRMRCRMAGVPCARRHTVGPLPACRSDTGRRWLIQTLESTPRGQTHWSTRGLAEASGLSRMTISRFWHAFGLQPHRSDKFKLSPDPQLIEKVRDIVDLYMNPPEHAVVFCVDEKSQIQALDRTQPLLPLRPRVVRQTATLPRPLHTHLWFMDQFGGALARRTH